MNRTMGVTEFKAKCLALLEEVSEKRSTITITKRGKPLATVTPTPKKKWKSSKGLWAGKIDIPDEVLMADNSMMWNVVRTGGVEPE